MAWYAREMILMGVNFLGSRPVESLAFEGDKVTIEDVIMKSVRVKHNEASDKYVSRKSWMIWVLTNKTGRGLAVLNDQKLLRYARVSE